MSSTLLPDPTTAPIGATPRPLETGVAPALVWVFIFAYVFGLLGLAFWSWWKYHGSEFDKKAAIRDHFVASRSISDFVLAMTTFATIFSGYTVVGVPGEMFTYGFFSFRWLFCTTPMAITLVFFASRLQFLSRKRDYVSPTDFITDRYNSASLRIIVSVGLAFPALVYVMAQFKSMGSTIEALSDANMPGYWAAFILMIVMCLYEVFGGVRAIAYTDTVQGIFLVLGFVLFFIAQADLFGGVEQAGELMRTTVSQANINLGIKYGKLPARAVVLGQDVLLNNTFQEMQWGFMFPFIFGFVFYPHLITRYQMAANTNSIKKTLIWITVALWLCMISSLFTGMVAIHHFGFGNPNIKDPSQVFGQVMRVCLASNAAYVLLGSIMVTASLAAFMSTADSAVNGFSACMTLDIVKPYPKFWKCGSDNPWTKDQIISIGRGISVVCALVAWAISELDIDMGALLTLQNSVLMQLFPAFFVGAVSRFPTNTSLISGILIGWSIIFGIQCGFRDKSHTSGCVSTGTSWYVPVKGVHPSLFAMVINFIVVFAVSAFQRFVIKQPKLLTGFDAIEENHTFPDKFVGFNITGKGSRRPCHFPWIGCTLSLLAVMLFVIPWYRDVDGRGKTVEDFSLGFPQWVRDGLLVTGIFSIGCILLTVFAWKEGEEEGEPTEDEKWNRGKQDEEKVQDTEEKQEITSSDVMMGELETVKRSPEAKEI